MSAAGARLVELDEARVAFLREATPIARELRRLPPDVQRARMPELVEPLRAFVAADAAFAKAQAALLESGEPVTYQQSDRVMELAEEMAAVGAEALAAWPAVVEIALNWLRRTR